jgi:hypothetical protein
MLPSRDITKGYEMNLLPLLVQAVIIPIVSRHNVKKNEQKKFLKLLRDFSSHFCAMLLLAMLLVFLVTKVCQLANVFAT